MALSSFSTRRDLCRFGLVCCTLRIVPILTQAVLHPTSPLFEAETKELSVDCCQVRFDSDIYAHVISYDMHDFNGFPYYPFSLLGSDTSI